MSSTSSFASSQPTAKAAVSSSGNVDYGYLRKLVFEHSQNVLDPSRDQLFETRLAKLLRNYGLSRIEELVRLLQLQANPELACAVAEAMTINETSFFRDGRPFELLRAELLPELIRSRSVQRRLRVWSAACSTGQEAYSIAMLLLEHFPALNSWNVKIEGTDISSEVVQRCKAGSYDRMEMNRGLSARNIVRFFDHHGESCTVKPELRNLCHFSQANLGASHLPFCPADRFDVVFLRNVMLYFSLETRKTLLANVHRLLAPDGLLFLGSSEQPADPALWTPVLSGGTCYYRPRSAR